MCIMHASGAKPSKLNNKMIMSDKMYEEHLITDPTVFGLSHQACPKLTIHKDHCTKLTRYPSKFKHYLFSTRIMR